MLGIKEYLVLTLVILQLLVATGCSNSTSASPPIILGSIPFHGFIGVPYEDELGADGGDELLSYRVADGPSWISLTSDNGANPRFFVFGVPDLDSKDELQEFDGRLEQVIIEVTDGEQTTTSNFQIQVDPNKADFKNQALTVKEGDIKDPVDPDRYDEKCEIPDMSPVTIDGRTAYPVPLEIKLPGAPELRTEISYNVDSRYDLDATEIESTNRGKARPDVDYASIGGSVVFEPGVKSCVIAIYIYDDSRVEVPEIFTVSLTGTVDGWASYSETPVTVTIVDNEPTVAFPSVDDVINEGSVQDYTLTLSEEVDYPIAVTVFVKTLGTTAEEGVDFSVLIDDSVCDANSDFSFNTCLLIFQPDTLTSTFRVSVLNDGDNSAVTIAKLDEQIVIESDVSVTFQDEPINIQINEWVDDVQVGSSDGDDQSASMVVDGGSNAIVGIVTGVGDIYLQIDSYSRIGKFQSFTKDPNDSIIKAKNGNILSSVSDHRTRTNDEVVFAMNTDGDIEEINRGLSDVYVRSYDRAIRGENYIVNWFETLATAGDDVANGVKISSTGDVYVYGFTTGTFDGKPVNAGGKDAYVAKYDRAGAFQWISILGSSGDEEITSIAFIEDAIVVTGTSNGMLGNEAFGGDDGFIVRIDKDGSALNIIQFGTAFNDYVTDMQILQQRYWVSGYSVGDFSIPEEGDFDPNGPARASSDVFALNFFDLVSTFDTSIEVGDPVSDDVSYTGASSSSTKQVFIGSETPGEFEDGGKGDLLLDDAVISAIDTTDSRNGVVSWNSQFGTDGDDRVINLSLFGDSKIFSLWESVENGATIFTLSTFSALNGEKLSTIPEPVP